MAFVSGGAGGGGGMPPQQNNQSSSLLGNIGNQQLLELMMQQQAQQQQAATPLTALLGLLGGAGSLGANPLAAASQQPLAAANSPLGNAGTNPQQNMLMNIQNQLALQQLMPQLHQLQNQPANSILSQILLYQQQLQQLNQQQQQATLLAQLQQAQQQQQQQVQQQHQQAQQQHQQQQQAARQAATPNQMSQSHTSAFQAPTPQLQQAQVPQASTGSVETAALNQERLLSLMEHQQSAIGIARREKEQAQQAQMASIQNHIQQQQAGMGASTSHDRAAAARNNSQVNPMDVHDRISRIISENEVIVQPQEPLLKRRPYHRQVGQQSSIDHDSNSSSTRTSPGIRDIRMLQNAGRTQSLYEPINGVRAFGGSLTSGQPLVRHQPAQHVTPICSYCQLAFPNEAGLQMHEQRCSKRLSESEKREQPPVLVAPSALTPAALEAAEANSASRHPLKRRLLMAVQEPAEQPPPPPQKISRADSNEIIVVGETRAPERKDGMAIDQYNPHMLPRRFTMGDIPLVTPANGPSASQLHHSITQPLHQQHTPVSLSLTGGHPTAFTHVPARAATLNQQAQQAAQLLQLQQLRQQQQEQQQQQQQHQQQAQQHQHHLLLQQHQQQQQQQQLQREQQHQHQQQAQAQQQSRDHHAAQVSAAAAAIAAASNQLSNNLLNAASTSAASNNVPSLLPPKIEAAKETVEEDNDPFSMKNFQLTGDCDRPYTLVLAEGSKVSNPDILRNSRNRGRNITSETFVCMHRAQPMFVQQKGNLSMYSNWHQVTVNEAESKLNIMFMGMCSARPRTGVHPFWRYSTANREQGRDFKMTHSSFWDISQKMRSRQQAEDEEAERLKAESDIEMIDIDSIPVKMDDVVEVYEPKPQVQVFEPIEKKEEPMEIDEKPSSFREQSNGLERDDIDDFELKSSPRHQTTKKTDPVIGGHRTDEVYVYVRGRGRGRYVCDRCGIRCKKPSMLKKHIKSHTDVRPFKCKQCNFSFKTKGNLTKHLGSKTHRRRIQNGGDDSDYEDRLEIATPDDDMMDDEERGLHAFDDDACSSDDEDDHMKIIQEMEDNPFKKFGQENILFERSAHTPPSRWVLAAEEEISTYWPDSGGNRQCSSAPPSAMPSPPKRKQTKAEEPTPFVSQMLFVTTAAPPSQTANSLPTYSNAVVPQRFGGGDTNGGGNTAAAPQAPAAGLLYNNYIAKEESLKCDQCDRSFRKPSELSLHQHTHNLEKHQAKNRMFQCPECRIPMRTKAQLAKHVETSHGSHIDDSVTASVDPCASTQSVLGGPTAMASNPRSFMCNDCNIGFRKHGILAKHLRSKTHVMKLETLRRLPEDSLSLITKRDNGQCLNEVDTTDCEKARTSLIAIVDAIRAENVRNQFAPLSSSSLILPSAGSSSSLECREQLPPSPVPADPVMVGRILAEDPLHLSNPLLAASRCYSESSSPFRSRCGSAASTVDISSARKKSDSISLRPDIAALAAAVSGASKLVSANVWVPPKPEGGVRHDSSAHLRSVHDMHEYGKDEMEVDVSSSPVHRNLSANGHPPPLTVAGTRCLFCEVNYDTPVDLEVHMYTDHMTMRDGTYFKCPKRFCGKVYPNKDCLRIHIVSHYKVADPNGDHREDDSVSSSTSLTVVGGRADDCDPRASPLSDATDSTCHSPANMDTLRATSSGESRTPDEPLRLPCSLCDKVFNDAASLQNHWFGHVSSRTHVCQDSADHCKPLSVCDAGFTTQDALAHHSASHTEQAKNINGIH